MVHDESHTIAYCSNWFGDCSSLVHCTNNLHLCVDIKCNIQYFVCICVMDSDEKEDDEEDSL